MRKKRKKRDLQRSTCSSITKTFSENAALTFLSENESFSSYQRKRLAQSFESSDEPHTSKRRITDNFLSKYKDVLEKLSEWPESTRMNWSELGSQCGIDSKNKGQMVKQILIESGIDVENYQMSRTHFLRRSKAKLPGNEISVPSMPTVCSLKEDISELLDSGKLTLGEPCCPFTIMKSHVIDGKLVSTPSQIYGRKIPLLEIRKKLLRRQEKFMRLMSDDDIDKLPLNDVKNKTSKFR